MLSIKQDSIKYNFLSLWYNSTWDWTQFSRAIDKHSKQISDIKHFLSYSWILRLLKIYLEQIRLDYLN